MVRTTIRAYQTRKDLRANNQRLIDYARAGGHVVVQYNKFEFNRLSEAPAEGFTGGGSAAAVSPFAPYPASVTYERVTLEDAPMNVLAPDHPYFNAPNRIGKADFKALSVRYPHLEESLWAEMVARFKLRGAAVRNQFLKFFEITS